MNYLGLFGPYLMTMGVVSELFHFGKISISDAVEIELTRIKAGISCTDVEEEVGLLLSDDHERGRILLDREYERNSLSEIERETLLVSDLLQILSNWDKFSDPAIDVEIAITDHHLEERYSDIRLFTKRRRADRTPQKHLQRVEVATSTGLTRLHEIAKQREATNKE